MHVPEFVMSVSGHFSDMFSWLSGKIASIRVLSLPYSRKVDPTVHTNFSFTSLISLCIVYFDDIEDVLSFHGFSFVPMMSVITSVLNQWLHGSMAVMGLFFY